MRWSSPPLVFHTIGLVIDGRLGPPLCFSPQAGCSSRAHACRARPEYLGQHGAEPRPDNRQCRPEPARSGLDYLPCVAHQTAPRRSLHSDQRAERQRSPEPLSCGQKTCCSRQEQAAPNKPQPASHLLRLPQSTHRGPLGLRRMPVPDRQLTAFLSAHLALTHTHLRASKEADQCKDPCSRRLRQHPCLCCPPAPALLSNSRALTSRRRVVKRSRSAPRIATPTTAASGMRARPEPSFNANGHSLTLRTGPPAWKKPELVGIPVTSRC